jgi:hypothetical protein
MTRFKVNTNELRVSEKNLLTTAQPVGMNPGTDVGGMNILQFIQETQIFLNSHPDAVKNKGNDLRALKTLISILRSNDCSLEEASNLSTDLADTDEKHDEDICEENPCQYCNLFTVIDQCLFHAIELQTSSMGDDGELKQVVSDKFRKEIDPNYYFDTNNHCISCNKPSIVSCRAVLESGNRYRFKDKVTVVRMNGTCMCGQINSYYVGSFLE